MMLNYTACEGLQRPRSLDLLYIALLGFAYKAIMFILHYIRDNRQAHYMDDYKEERIPKVVLDTSALKALGFDGYKKPYFKALLSASKQGKIKVYVPEPVFGERVIQYTEEDFKSYLKINGFNQEALKKPISEIVEQAHNGLKALLNEHNVTVLELNDDQEKRARIKQEEKHPIFQRGVPINNYYDCLIHEVIVDFLNNQIEHENIYVIIDDKDLRESLNFLPATLFKYFKPQPFIEEVLGVNKKSLTSPAGAEPKILSSLPVIIGAYGYHLASDRAIDPQRSSNEFSMKDALQNSAERHMLSQKRVMAATRLLFPMTEHSFIATKIDEAWGILPSETERAAQVLIENGYLEDLVGDYIIRNESFAEQAIYDLGDDVEALLGVIE